MKVLYIGGIGRSGSTLVERLLGSVDGFQPLGEIVQIWERIRRDDRCSCGRELSGCEFWRAVGDRAFGGWHRVDLDRRLADQGEFERLARLPRLAANRLPPGRRAAVAEHVSYYQRIYAAAASVSGARVIIDSSKRPGIAGGLRWAGEADVRIVHLVRDPRGVAYSFSKTVRQPDRDGAEYMPRFAPATTSVNWLVQNAAFELLRWADGRPSPAGGPAPVPVRRFRYEELLADPGRIVREMVDHAGEAMSDEAVARLCSGAVPLPVWHTMAGNPIRFRTGALTLRPDDAWRTNLVPRQRRIVSAICAPLLLAYGYPLSAGVDGRLPAGGAEGAASSGGAGGAASSGGVDGGPLPADAGGGIPADEANELPEPVTEPDPTVVGRTIEWTRP